MDEKQMKKLEDRMKRTEAYEEVNTISAPFDTVPFLCKEVAAAHPFCFNPEADFATYGVIGEGSRGWMFCWERVCLLTKQKKGTVFVMQHYMNKKEGGQQDGEELFADSHGVKVVPVYYNDDHSECDESGRACFRHSRPKKNAIRMKNILFVGNPGSGKSTLLNSYAGKVVFRSGVSCGKGLTFVFDTYAINKTTRLFDTPGLNDAARRAAAGEAITESLKQYGTYKIVFVMGLDEGRVRPADIVTMKEILYACPEIEAESYSVVINKCDQRLLRTLDDPCDSNSECSNREEILNLIFDTVDRKTSRVFFAPKIEDLVEEDDKLWPENSFYAVRTFIDTGSGIRIEPANVANIDTRDFEAKIEELQKELLEMQRKRELAEQDRDQQAQRTEELQRKRMEAEQKEQEAQRHKEEAERERDHQTQRAEHLEKQAAQAQRDKEQAITFAQPQFLARQVQLEVQIQTTLQQNEAQQQALLTASQRIDTLQQAQEQDRQALQGQRLRRRRICCLSSLGIIIGVGIGFGVWYIESGEG
jgi:GTP-binding protein EngB required for normal cell division